MKNILIIDGHQHYEFAPGGLTQSLVERAVERFSEQGCEVQVVTVKDGYDIEEQLKLHQWADLVMVQAPINWMGMPWVFKKYMDEVYTAGMGGALCNGDGRSADAPDKNYGLGGTLTNTRYWLSVTFNAPKAAFDNPSDPFFAGKGVDDLLYPQHQNFKFFGMSGLPTFACFDVMKNPTIEADFVRFDHFIRAFFS